MIEAFGIRLKSFREKAGLTQDELAKAIGVSRSTIWQYESGTVSEPRYSALVAMAEALGVEVTELAGPTEPNPSPEPARGAR